MNNSTKLLLGVFLFLVLFAGAFSADVASLSNSDEFDKTQETHCKDGQCYTTIYSGTRFVEEGKDFVKIEEAKSLFDHYNVVYLEQDPKWNITVHDFNWTFLNVTIESEEELVDMRLNREEKSITLKVPRGNYALDFKTINQELFNFTNISFGKASTTIQLQDADSENLWDTYVSAFAPTTNYGTATTLYVEDNDGAPSNLAKRIYFKFNISSIPASMTISEAKVCGLFSSIYVGASANTSIHHVTNHTWGGLNETNITWNNQVCGTAFDNSGNCNLTQSDYTTISGQTPGWVCLTVTNAVNNEYGNSDLNVSFALKTPEDTDHDYERCESKESATPADRPYLNVSYHSGNSPYISNAEETPTDPATYDKDTSWIFNATICDDDGYGDINTVYFEWNGGTNESVTTTTNVNASCDEYSITKNGLSAGSAIPYKWYAEDSYAEWGGLSDDYTITTVTPIIHSWTLNDTYLTFNQSVLVVVNASSVGAVSMTAQTSEGSANITLGWNGTLYDYELTSSDLGNSTSNATRVNITYFYINGGNFTAISNVSTDYLDYSRTQLANISHTPAIVYNWVELDG